MGNAPSTVPQDAQLSAVNASLQCRYLNTDVARAVYVSATAPIAGAGGDQVYFSDIVANLYLPTAARTADLTLTLSVANASPSLWTVNAKTSGNVIAFGTVLDVIGPFTLANDSGDGSTLANLGLHSITGTIDGNQLTCGQSFDYIVTSVVSVGTTQNGTVRSASRGLPGPPIPLDTRFNAVNGSVFVNTDTLFGLNRREEYNFLIEGNGPAYLRQGQAFNFTNHKIFFTISGDLIRDLTNRGSDTYGVAVSTSEFGITLRNTNWDQDYNTGYNISNSAVGADLPLRTGRYVDGPSSQTIIFPLPNWNSLTLTNITAAGAVGSTVSYFFPGIIYTIAAAGVHNGASARSYVLFSPIQQHRLFTAPIMPNNTVLIRA